MSIRGLIKIKCCIVAVTSGVTAIMLGFGWNLINTGITATIALLYIIALLLLISIMMHEDSLMSIAKSDVTPE